jgi:hypothetical protein
MGSAAASGIETWRRVAGGFIAAIVLWTYAYARSHGDWPPGHPWSGMTLSLLAVHNFLPLKSKTVAGLVAALAGLGSAVLWLLSLQSASAARSGASAANAPQEVQSGAQLAGPVEAAADTALTEAARLAASCHPEGGPVGSGKVRVVYSEDGNVQSVEMLSEEFRDTLTGSCVRMVFRRAKIPAFNGPTTTFIKGFSIPAEGPGPAD